MPTVFDHALAVVFGVAVPALGVWRARSLMRRWDAGGAISRTRVYAETLAVQWLMAGLIVAWWAWSGRPWITLSVGAPAGALVWIILGVVGLAGVGFAVQVARVRASDEARRRVRGQLGAVAPILPRTPGELRLFLTLGATAGVCEELLYRGYLMWWAVSLGSPVWLAVLVTAALFGAGHAYQGVDGAMRIFALGVVFGVIVTLTQSIWVAAAAHVLIDVASGVTAYLALGSGPAGDRSPGPPAAQPAR
ncbi:MAG: CPBP family intramembrane metalloprotease [Planctomycetota bacterium]|nr:MAG: CPBP family intramembrane metalloprotease [Planctomycetota bacterium]